MKLLGAAAARELTKLDTGPLLPMAPLSLIVKCLPMAQSKKSISTRPTSPFRVLFVKLSGGLPVEMMSHGVAHHFVQGCW